MHRFLGFLIHLYHSILRHNLGMLAAVLAFFGFSATVPLIGVLIYGALLIVPTAAVHQLVVGSIHAYVPDLPNASIFLANNVNRLSHLRSDVSFIGIIGLIWTVVGGFVSFQQALDVIWDVRIRRSFFRQYIVGFLMLAILLGLTASAALSMLITPTLLAHIPAEHTISANAAFIRDLSYLLFPFLLFLTCICCYRLLPSKTVQMRFILIGALMATVGVYVSRLLFMVYTHHLGNYQFVYGTLTFIMLFAFWIYIVSAVVLFGGEVATSLQNVYAAPNAQDGVETINPS